jgi:hypothetical protein
MEIFRESSPSNKKNLPEKQSSSLEAFIKNKIIIKFIIRNKRRFYLNILLKGFRVHT